jgi:hypothetical protein
MKLLIENWQTYLTEMPQPHLNKYDPGSLLGQVVHLLEKEGLVDAAASVREVSTVVSQAWVNKDQLPDDREQETFNEDTI